VVEEWKGVARLIQPKEGWGIIFFDVMGDFLIPSKMRKGSHHDTVLAVSLGSHLVGFKVLNLFHVD